MAFDANPRHRVPSSSASQGQMPSAGSGERSYGGRGGGWESERRSRTDEGMERLASENTGRGRDRGSEKSHSLASGRGGGSTAAVERSRDRIPREATGRSAEREATGRSAERDQGGGRKRSLEEVDRGRDGLAGGDGGRGRVERGVGRAVGRERDPEPVDRGRDRHEEVDRGRDGFAGGDGGRGRVERGVGRAVGRERDPEPVDRSRDRYVRDAGARAGGDRDRGGRRGEREGVYVGRGADQRQTQPSRDSVRDSVRDSSRDSFRGSSRDSVRGSARDPIQDRSGRQGGRAPGGEEGNGPTNYRAWESRTVSDRNRDVAVKADRPPLPTVPTVPTGSSGSRGRSGEGARVSSSLSGKPAPSGSQSATLSFLHSFASVSGVSGVSAASSDQYSLSVQKRDSGRDEARSSGGAPLTQEDEGRLQLDSWEEDEEEDLDDIEPGEFPSGRGPPERRRSPRSGELAPPQLAARNENFEEKALTEPRDRPGIPTSPPKKRKFTPVVWDYEEKPDLPLPSTLPSEFTGSPASNTSSLSAAHAALQPLLPPVAVESRTPPLETISPPTQPSPDRATPPRHGERKISSESPSSPSSPSSVSTPSSLSSGEIRSPPAVVFTKKPVTVVAMEDPDAVVAMEDPVAVVATEDPVAVVATEDAVAVVAVRNSILINTVETQTASVDYAERMDSMPQDGNDSSPEPGEVTGFESRFDGEGADDYDHFGLEPGELPAELTVRVETEDEDVIAVNISTSRWATEAGTPDQGQSPPEAKEQISLLDREKSRTFSGSNGRPGAQRGSRSPEKRHAANGKVGSGSDRGSHASSMADEEYERRLNDRELMELDEDSEGDEEEEQRPEEESDLEDGEGEGAGSPIRVIDMLKGCRSVEEFQMLSRIDEGTYGVVYQARDKQTGEVVALKRVKMAAEKEGFPMTALREMNVLLSIHHPSVVNVKEVVVGSTIDSIYMVMEYMEHELKALMETLKEPFSQSEVKCLMLQLLDGVNYLHGNWVLHRDLKTSNLLMNNRGELKICDFGLARQYGSPLQVYSHRVVTLWYRAPELLLGSKHYSTAIDMWSLGCIMAELMEKKPLLDGRSEIEQINKIFSLLGTPSKEIWPDFVNLPGAKANFVNQKYNMLRDRFPAASFGGQPALSESGFELLNSLLTYDPKKRITAEAALSHPWFREEPLAKAKEAMPAYPPRSKHDRKLRRLMKSPDPLEEQHRREIREGRQGPMSIFGIV